MKIKNFLTSLALATTLCVNPSYAGSIEDKLDASIKQTEILPDEGKLISRTEILFKLPEYNSDVFFLNQFQDKKDSYKARLQVFPVRYSSLSLGFVGEHNGSSNRPSTNNLGFVGRITTKPTKDIFFKTDLRYFPEEQELSTKTFLDTKDFLYDITGSYNINQKNLVLIPSIDYKLTDNFFFGIEAKFAGKPGNLNKSYLGLRAGVNF